MLTLGFVLHLENVTVSNFGVFPGRSAGDYVRERVDLSVSFGGFLLFAFLKDSTCHNRQNI